MTPRRWPPPGEPCPVVVAEALEAPRSVPLAAQALVAGSGAAVAGTLARAALGDTDESPLPAWLRADQRELVYGALHAIRRFGGALMAEPPGTGKTWMALGVAHAAFGGRATALVPAAAVPHWQRIAARTGTTLRLCTHERASRGALPSAEGLVIVDESHRLRNPATRRYDVVAPWLVGLPALLLTATPVVNRTADLVHQLRLCVSDDALRAFGVPSLRALSSLPSLPLAVTQLVLYAPAHAHLPQVRTRLVRVCTSRGMSRLVHDLGSLALSPDPASARLIRGVLLRAAASSPAALAAALGRYRTLLDAAADAERAGRRIPAAALRRWAGTDDAQTVLWELVPADDGAPTLALGDAGRVIDLARRARALGAREPKAAFLRELVADGGVTVLFTSYRATVHWLRRVLGCHRTAWCTGDGAGIGMERRPREVVLSLFRPGSRPPHAPALLVASDAAAESLDLQAASRVVHVDLPWTPSRLRQREGRVARIGAAGAIVEVVRLEPPASIERQARLSAILEGKQTLGRRARLVGDSLLAGRATLRSLAARPAAPASLACVPSGIGAVLVAVRLHAWAGEQRVPLGVRFMVTAADGMPREDDPLTLLARAADEAEGCERPVTAPVAAIEAALRRAASDANGVELPDRTDVQRRLCRRLGDVARRAARLRQDTSSGACDAARQWFERVRTAGSERLAHELLDIPDSQLLERITRLPPPPPRHVVEAEVAGVIVFH